jgi:hypothetical protein
MDISSELVKLGLAALIGMGIGGGHYYLVDGSRLP